MAKAEIDHIKEEIERSGFPFEYKIASTLKNDGWEVHPSSPYWDRDEGKWRSIDIKAYKSIEQTSDGKDLEPYILRTVLIIECKKTDIYAWVFFPWLRNASDMKLPRVEYLDFLTIIKQQSLLLDGIKHHRYPSPAEFQMLNLDSELLELSNYQAMVTPETARKLKFLSEFKIIEPDTFKFLAANEKALSYNEIKLGEKKRDSGPNEIFEAINALIKGTKYQMELHSSAVYAGAELIKRGNEKGKFEIIIFLPILAFKGKLYTWLKKRVNKVNEILVDGRCHTKRYFENMLIDVVEENHFQDLLLGINEDCENLSIRIDQNRKELDEEVKKNQRESLFRWTSFLKGDALK